MDRHASEVDGVRLYYKQDVPLREAERTGGVLFKLNTSTTHRFGCVPTHERLLELLARVPPVERFAYEVIRQDTCCKPYIDYDCAYPDGRAVSPEAVARMAALLRGAIRAALAQHFGRAVQDDEIFVTNGSRDGKLSLHATVATWRSGRTLAFRDCHTPASGARAFAWAVRGALPEELQAPVDLAVYTRNRAMRLKGCPKSATNPVPLEAVGDDGDAPLERYLITCVRDAEVLEPPEALVRAAHGPRAARAAPPPGPLERSPDDLEWIQSVVRAVPGRFWKPYETWIQLAMACKSLGVPYELFDELSRQHGEEKYGNTRAAWDSLQPRTSNTPHVGTLLHFIRQDDAGAFEELLRARARPAVLDRVDALVTERLSRLYGAGSWRSERLMRYNVRNCLYVSGDPDECCACGLDRRSMCGGSSGPLLRIDLVTLAAHVYCKAPCRGTDRLFVGRLPEAHVAQLAP